MFLEIHNWSKGWIITWGSSQELLVLHIPYRCKLNNLLPNNVMGLKILKQKCECGSSIC